MLKAQINTALIKLILYSAIALVFIAAIVKVVL